AMKLVTYRANVSAAARLGAIVDDLVVDLQQLGLYAGEALPDNMLDFIDLGPCAITSTTALLERHRGQWPVGVARPLVNVRLLAPIPRPRKNIFG
ncbi:fumarylacetoacetate hydrolase family protein, partial [Escherichia coli]